MTYSLTKQRWGPSQEAPQDSRRQCPYCHNLLTGPEYEHASSEFERAVEEAATFSPSVKYQRTLRSLKGPQGTEIVSVKEQYEKMSNSTLVRAAVALDSFALSAAIELKTLATVTRKKTKEMSIRVKRGTKRLAARVFQWFNKWVFFVFNRTEEGLTKVAG